MIASSPPEALAPGTIVADRFEIHDVIGEGGMGVVYRANQIKLNRMVALKVILATHATKAGARRRFEREARVASALRHPNAVEIYDFGDYQNTLYLAMELLDGVSLRAIVDADKPPLSVRRTCQIGAQIADVLIAASQINLTHRDLKPENVILDRSRAGTERTVVVDFGLAFINEDEQSGRMTREGVVTGTPDYMSPEQARGSQITPAADIYALGCMLHEMLTSVPPFDGDTAIVLSRHLFVAAKPIREAFPHIDIPASLDELIVRMLSKTPTDRPSATSVRDALRSLDPNAPERSAGVNSDGELLGRAARMVSVAPASRWNVEAPRASLPSAADKRKIAWIGEFDNDFLLALAVNGFTAEEVNDSNELPTDADAIVALNATIDEVRNLVQSGRVVIADANASDVDRLAQLLRVGVSEVVIQPLSADDLARKLRRAIKKASRG
ncbi:MAG: serine/threonine-protein kinase [Polyangiales bacterium]